MYQHIQQTEAMRNFAADLRRRDEDEGFTDFDNRSYRTTNPLLRTEKHTQSWNAHFALRTIEGHDPRDIFTFSLAQLMRL